MRKSIVNLILFSIYRFFRLEAGISRFMWRALISKEIENFNWSFLVQKASVVVLETGLGLETSLETSLFRLGLGLELSGLGLDLGLEPSGLGFFGRDQHETSN